MRVNMRITQSLLTVAVTFLAVGCMDINPPTSAADISQDELLHSISLPFSKAVYAVGYRDSLVVTGRLVNGDTTAIDPSQISWSTSSGTQAVTVDSSGVLSVNGYTSGRIFLYASYQRGEISRADTAQVYIGTKQPDVIQYSFTAIDSTRGGFSLSSYFMSGGMQGKSRYNVSVLDENSERLEGLPAGGAFFDLFARDAETGHEVPFAFLSTIGSEEVTLVNFGLGTGSYWIGIRSYLFGRYYADSILYQSLPAAEVSYTITNVNNQFSIVPGNLVVQPCAFFVVQNQTSDSVMVDLSIPDPDRTCGEEEQGSGPIVISPGQVGIVRKLGYSAGQTIDWTATVKGRPLAPMIGKISFVDPN